MTDTVERARAAQHSILPQPELIKELADEVERLRAATSLHHELVAALEKFTAHYEPWMGEMGGHHDDVECIVHSRHTFGDLRRARAALQKAKQGDKK